MIPNNSKIMEAIRETAAAEIMPRFNALSESDITEKGPNDLVTTADIEAEKRLELLLKSLAPGSVVIGEEAADADPKRLDLLKGLDPVWLLDPLDGTNNFVRGEPCFAIIVAYCVAGETLAGWIHDPISDATAWAVKGGGAWMAEGARTGNRVMRVGRNSVSPMTGFLSGRTRRKLAQRRERGEGNPPQGVHYGCVGREYMDLAAGALQFSYYTRRLKPWDHAAGVLIHQEAGGYSAITCDGAPYNPARGGTYGDAALLLAPNRDDWEILKGILED